MIKFKVHIEQEKKTVAHICTIDSLVVRNNAVYVNVENPNTAKIICFELPKSEALNIISLLTP